MREMELRHELEEYVKRPAKDQKCLERLMFALLLIVVITIVYRVVLYSF